MLVTSSRGYGVACGGPKNPGTFQDMIEKAIWMHALLDSNRARRTQGLLKQC
jgi:hypothetical protein